MEQLNLTYTPAYNKHYRYNHSKKGRARTWRYNHSCLGRACASRYGKTEKRRGMKRAWELAHPSYRMDLYYRIQNEAGSHMQPVVFYPGYRIIRALENAEIVEIVG